MNDVFGNELKIGDTVVCLRVKGRYRVRVQNSLHEAVVIGFSKQKIRIRYTEDDYVTTRFSEQVCKYIEPTIEELYESI